MSQPPPAKSSFFSSTVPSIRIPTFASPTVKSKPSGGQVFATREEERQARLKGQQQQWTNLNSLLPKGPQALPSFAPRKPVSSTAPTASTSKKTASSPNKKATSTTTTPGSTRRRKSVVASSSGVKGGEGSGGKTKKRQSSIAVPSPVAQVEREREEEEEVAPSANKRRRSSVASKGRKSVAAPVEVVEEREEEAVPDVLDFDPEEEEEPIVPIKRAAPIKRRPSKAGPAPPIAPSANASSSKKSRKSVALESVLEEESEREEPVASGSGLSAAAKKKVEKKKEKKPKEVVPVAGPSKSRKRPVVEDPEEEAQPVVAPAKTKSKTKRPSAAVPVPIARSPTKRVRLSSPPAVPSSPVSDAADSEAVDDNEDAATSRTKSKGKGKAIRTERLRSNKGRLNAVDVAWGGVKRRLEARIASLPPGKSMARSLRRYAGIVQTLFLTRSDQLSTLSSTAATLTATRSRSKQLRLELLGVTKARNNVGMRMREEEAQWIDSRRRAETTRDLHSYLNDLSSAALDWQHSTEPDTALSTSAVLPQIVSDDDLLGRLENVAMVLRGGGLVERVERLNRELRSGA